MLDEKRGALEHTLGGLQLLEAKHCNDETLNGLLQQQATALTETANADATAIDVEFTAH